MPKYWKACKFIHDFRIRQHLVRPKSKAENFGLFALYTCYFLSAVWLPNGQLLTVIEETVSLTQCESLHLGYLFLVQRCLGGVGSLQLIESPVGFDDNVMIHLATHPKLQKILSSDLNPIFTKSESTPKTVIPWHCGGLWAYLIECKIYGLKL